MHLPVYVAASLLLAAAPARGQAPVPTDKPYVDPCIDAGIKKTVVFLGSLEKPDASPDGQPLHPKPRYVGTAFLVQKEDVFYIVTAAHVVSGFARLKGSDAELRAFLNWKDGRLFGQPLREIKRDLKADWMALPNADVAILPFGIAPISDVRTIPEEFFVPAGRLGELLDVFFVSYQPGIEPSGRIAPVLRRGMISAINSDRSFYLDAFAFPGNSGSPVFLRSTAIRTGDQPEGCRFVGLVGEYLPYQEPAVSLQTGRARVIFEENTGLAKVWPADAILQLMATPDFQKQHRRLHGAASKKK
jgi:hypothetical protein